MSYLNVDVGGSFFITSTIFDSSPLLPRHISCLSTNLQLFIGILTSAVTHSHPSLLLVARRVLVVLTGKIY